jgi:glycosyltransferase involved in cell wall biosynthesis
MAKRQDSRKRYLGGVLYRPTLQINMPHQEMKRIGIFQYEWPVKVYTVDLVSKLAESGFQTDLYLYECNTTFVSPEVLVRYPNVRVIELRRNLAQKIIGRVIRISRKALNLPYRIPKRMPGLVSCILKRVGSYNYDHLIGIEKNGLIWAGMLSEKLNIPFLYYSLELFIDGHPEVASYSNSDEIRQEEKKYHSRATGTIIQDKLRAKVLFESNGVQEKNAIYIPVSIIGKKIEEKGHFLHERLGIAYSKKIILYIGQVRKKRGVNELLKCVDQLDEDFVMVFHGPFLPDISIENTYGGRVYFSKEMVSNEDIPKIVSSAYIGIAFYGDANINDKLTAFSSEKIAYYMQSGIPIIAHRNESYELLMKQQHCGELIEHIDQLPAAVRKMDADYAIYRKNAFAAFEKYYSFEVNMRGLVEYLSCN